MPFQRKTPLAIGTKGRYPGFIGPALATSIEKVPGGERWLHEIKFDGYRVQVHVVNEAVKIFTRRGHDWTNRFRKIADDAWHISARSAIVYAEVDPASGRLRRTPQKDVSRTLARSEGTVDAVTSERCPRAQRRRSAPRSRRFVAFHLRF